jgi:hypothetical protein
MSEAGSDPEQPEILGRLPRSRPGRRSPRRDEAARARERRAERVAAESDRRAAADERVAGRGEAPRAAEPPGPADALAGVARTGVAVAGGAVGLGLRAAGGALRAIRGTVDRR